MSHSSSEKETLEKLLEKDPAQCCQTPNELLKAIPTITGAIDTRRRITCQSLQKVYPGDSRVGPRKPPARLAVEKISVARLPMSTSLQSLPGLGLESQRSSTIGSDEWLLRF